MRHFVIFLWKPELFLSHLSVTLGLAEKLLMIL